jgi:hypothetical protein
VVKLIYGEGHKVASDGYGHAPPSHPLPLGRWEG